MKADFQLILDEVIRQPNGAYKWQEAQT